MKRAILLALATELAALAGLYGWLGKTPEKAVPEAAPAMALRLVELPVPQPSPQPAPRPNPPKAPSPPAPKPPPKARHTPAPRQEPFPAPEPSPAPSPVSVPPPPAATPPAQAEPAAAPPAPGPAVKASYLAQVKAVIQTALRYPEAARMMGEEGRVRVRFVLDHGQVSGFRILVPGGMAAFDQAARQAVEAARIPSPPKEMGNEALTLTLWVEFHAVQE